MNSFGKIFRISLFGESHNNCIGVTIDNCPAGISLSENDFFAALERRKPKIFGTTERIENDFPQIISGVFNEKTTGTPITILFENKNKNSNNYSEKIIRPSHSDFVAMKKFHNFNDFRGSGMFSGRMTLGIVAAGVISKKILNEFCSKNLEIEAKIISVKGNPIEILNNEIHPKKTFELIKSCKNAGDSLGGIIECKIKNLEIGIGEPFFDSLESVISHIIFSIPGIKGIEFGAGFEIANLSGSAANDCFSNENGETKTNNSGGINAGISNGNEIIFRVAVRPTPSIKKEQETFDFFNKKLEKLSISGFHDVCFALRTPVIVEAAAAIALTDLIFLNNSVAKADEK
jgi:chorismate synthase